MIEGTSMIAQMVYTENPTAFTGHRDPQLRLTAPALHFFLLGLPIQYEGFYSLLHRLCSRDRRVHLKGWAAHSRIG